jgi:hypothetical protein
MCEKRLVLSQMIIRNTQKLITSESGKYENYSNISGIGIRRAFELGTIIRD